MYIPKLQGKLCPLPHLWGHGAGICQVDIVFLVFPYAFFLLFLIFPRRNKGNVKHQRDKQILIVHRADIQLFNLNKGC